MPAVGSQGPPSDLSDQHLKPFPLTSHGRKAIRAKRSLVWLLRKNWTKCENPFTVTTNNGKKFVQFVRRFRKSIDEFPKMVYNEIK